MIQTFSSTIRRKEMDAVLTCMVDEKIGPGELNGRLIQTVKEFFSCAGAVALRSPSLALKYAFKALDVKENTKIMISALAPSWQVYAVKEAGCEPLILDVDPVTSLVTAEIVAEGMKNGGAILLLHETAGILPDFDGILALDIPVIEDVSQSAGASVPLPVESENPPVAVQENGDSAVPAGKKAGTFGIFSICGLEEHDVITAGGGAILISPGRREWPVLKSIAESIPSVEILPDINSALGFVQFKEYGRNEAVRKEIYSLYARSVLSGKNKVLTRDSDSASTIWSFPLVLNGGFKDVKQYTQRKEIEVRLAFEDSIIMNVSEETAMTLKNAKTLALRTVLFPLYPRLTRTQVEKIAKVLVTLP